MSIDREYNAKDIIPCLKSSVRKTWYEYNILIKSKKSNKWINNVKINNARISFDSKSEIMRTFSGEMDDNEYELMDAILYVEFCLDIKGKTFANGNTTARWGIGVFILDTSKDMMDGRKIIKLKGYDLGKRAYDDKLSSRLVAKPNTSYIGFAEYLIEYTYDAIKIESSEKTRKEYREWSVGTRKLKVVNELLNAIAYEPLWFDGWGVAQMKRYVPPEKKTGIITFSDDDESILLDSFSIKSNKFEIPNKFVRFTENPDADYIISVFKNSDPKSLYSTVTRGRTIVDSKSVNDVATQGDLDVLTMKAAIEATQSTEKISFETLPIPGIEFHDVFYLFVHKYDIYGKFQEESWEMDLNPGGKMKHVMERVVSFE